MGLQPMFDEGINLLLSVEVDRRHSTKTRVAKLDFKIHGWLAIGFLADKSLDVAQEHFSFDMLTSLIALEPAKCRRIDSKLPFFLLQEICRFLCEKYDAQNDYDTK